MRHAAGRGKCSYRAARHKHLSSKGLSNATSCRLGNPWIGLHRNQATNRLLFSFFLFAEDLFRNIFPSLYVRFLTCSDHPAQPVRRFPFIHFPSIHPHTFRPVNPNLTIQKPSIPAQLENTSPRCVSGRFFAFWNSNITNSSGLSSKARISFINSASCFSVGSVSIRFISQPIPMPVTRFPGCSLSRIILKF